MRARRSVTSAGAPATSGPPGRCRRGRFGTDSLTGALAARVPGLLCALMMLTACHGPTLAQVSRSASEQASGAVPAPRPPTAPIILPRLTLREPLEGAGVGIPIYDPSGHALDRLHGALRRAARGEGQARLLFYGASHVAGDMFTGTVRRILQSRFGDAGHGFVMPARPWNTYRQSDVNLESTETWHTDRVGKKDDRKDGWYGLAGMSVSTASSDDTSIISTTVDNEHGQRVGRFEVWYLAQPGGGQLDVLVDGHLARRIDTASIVFETGYATFDVEDGPHALELRPKGDGEVRLFGVTVDRLAPGVIVDTVGINGARASIHLKWNQELLREHIQRRDPDLIVLAYGTNESGDTRDPIDAYEARLRTVVAQTRATAPTASCLLIGPSDRPIQNRRSWLPRPRTAQIVDVQRRVAEDAGCGFFDLVAFQGGAMSMVDWAAMSPPLAQKDHIHFTAAGYERLGEVLTDALLRGWSP